MIFFSICSSIITTAAAAAKAMPRLQADFDTSFTHALAGHAAAYRARGCVQFSRRYLANSLPERGRRRPRTGSPTTAAVGPERHSRPPSVVFRVVPRRPAGRRAAVDAGRRREPRGRAARRPRRRVRRFCALGALGAPPDGQHRRGRRAALHGHTEREAAASRVARGWWWAGQ